MANRIYLAVKNNTDELICMSDKKTSIQKYIVANDISDYRVFFSDDEDFIEILYIDYLDAVYLIEFFVEGYGEFICTSDEYCELNKANYEYIHMIKNTIENMRTILLNSYIDEKDKKKILKAAKVLFKLSKNTVDKKMLDNKALRKAVELHNEIENRRYTLNNRHLILLV